MSPSFTSVFLEWARSNTERVMPFGERLRIEENLRQVCVEHPQEAAAVLCGMLADLADTLPRSDPWRQLPDIMAAGDNVSDLATYDSLYHDVPGGDEKWPYAPIPLDSCILVGCSFSSPELVRTLFWSLNTPVHSDVTLALTLLMWRRQHYGVNTDRAAVASALFRGVEVESADDVETLRLSSNGRRMDRWCLEPLDQD